MRPFYIASVAVFLALNVLALPSGHDSYLVARVVDDWSTISADKKFLQKGRLNPQPGETDMHITYKKGGQPTHVDQYQVWKQNPYNEGKMTDAGRWRGNDGKTHGGIPPPIWHPAAGENKNKHAYSATPSQNPPSYEQAGFSKSIADAVSKMPTKGNPKGLSKDDTSNIKSKAQSAPTPENKSPLQKLPSIMPKAKPGRKGSKTI